MTVKNKGRILIVDDNDGILKTLKFTLRNDFDEILTIRNPNLILSTLRQSEPDVILLDMNFNAGMNTGNEGIFWLSEILKLDPDAAVVMITAYAEVDLAVRAIKLGALDFIVKPWDDEKLLSTLQTARKLRQSKKEIIHLKQKQEIFRDEVNKTGVKLMFGSDSMKKVMDVVLKVAATDANVLLYGENGTGKELIAREIHNHSRRKGELFSSVDLGSISESLFESELFGHVRGAFTDAKTDRMGRFEAANGGTLFLDEISNLNFSLQSKLLSVLQNRQIIRLGSTQPVDVNVRLVSATNRSIQKMIQENLFREDLLYRINTIQIEIPPLRERGEDILLLAENFLRSYGRKYDKPLLKLNSSTANKLQKYSWPGNVRELQHTIEKAVILCEGNVITETDLFFNMGNVTHQNVSELYNLEEIEKITIKNAIEKCRGNLSCASELLGISRKTLYNKIEKYGL
jgi:DNA-binding NtrC family response regulator